MSGIEVIGLVLGVLPLFIEAGKAYSRGVESIRKVSSSRERDEKLMEFYGEFYWEIVQLHRQIQGIVEHLPHLSDKRKAELSMDMRLEDWQPEADVSRALLDFFGLKEDLDAFLVVIGKIAQLLSQLIKDPTVHISSSNLDTSKMFARLKGFAADKEAQQASSTIKERIRFWKKEKDRTTCLKNMATWNKRLFRLTEQARREPVAKKTIITNHHVPSSHLRMLSQKLYKALAKRWRCGCQEPHEAKVCLKARGSSDGKQKPAETESVDFDFLFSIEGSQMSGHAWQEGRVLVRSDGGSEKDERSLLERVCDALGCSAYTDQCLQLLVEDSGVDETVWQLRSLPSRLPNIGRAQAESLGEIIHRSIKFPLVTKRRLAVIFAHSLLQFHDSQWLSKDWNKSQIFFFCGPTGLLDFQRPYLSTKFAEEMPGNSKGPDFSRFHRNPSILALGILLIEIHTERLIESFRTRNEMESINSNTDLLVANRVVKTLEDCSLGYRDAIQACLDTPWIPAGQRVNLEDTATRAGVYQDVIQPLENELVYLFREKI